jgi:hypothetical protein
MTAPLRGARRGRVARGAGGRSTGAVQGSSSVQAMTSTEVIETLTRQLPPLPPRPHPVRGPVLVHEFPAGTLGSSDHGGWLARDDWEGHLLPAAALRRGRAARHDSGRGAGRPPAVLHTPEGRAVLRRAWEQLPTLCRPPDYADLGPQRRVGGGYRCDEVGIITMPRERRRVHREADSGPV